MEGDPKETGAALKRLLSEEKQAALGRAGGEAFGSLPARPLLPTVARAAAAALVERLRVAEQQAMMSWTGGGGPGQPAGGPGAPKPDYVDPARQIIPDSETVVVGTLLLPAATTGLGHPDTRGRRSCLEAIRLAARTVTERIPDGRQYQANDMPPEILAQLKREQAALVTAFQPLTLELQGACKPLSATLDADSPGVFEAACGALEEIAEVRQRLAGMVGGVGAKAADELTAALRDSGVVAKLARKLSHQEVTTQLAAVYILETLQAEAAPAAKEVADALADKNPYVRWGAARTAGRMAPAGAAQTVRGLAKLLTDEHEDVRLTAAAALARYGPAAKDAVPALAQAVKKGEADERRLAIAALLAIGAGAVRDKKDLVGAALRDALKDNEVEVRLSAVRAFGRLDPTGKENVEALRAALNDTNPDVRRAASEALLTD
jgi:HEAT repeat protein